MGVYLEIVFTVLGGLIAGIVGISSTYISLRAHRREKHLEEHKDNLKLLRGALLNGKEQIWPFVYGAENLILGKNYPINDVLGTGIDVITNQSVLDLRDDTFYSVDMILYEDIKHHFPELLDKLAKTHKDIKENAKTIYEKLNKISLSIYGKLNKENPDLSLMYPNEVPKTMTDGTSKLTFNLTIDSYQHFIAGTVFLFTIKEDQDEWPTRVNILKQIGLYEVLKNIGNDVNSEMKAEISEMLELRNKLFSDIDNCVGEIEIILHQNKLKGRCKLA